MFQNLPTPNTGIVKKSVQYMSAYPWNTLDSDTRKITRLVNLKRSVKNLSSRFLTM